MGFGGSGSGSSTISGSGDASMSNPTDGQVITWNASLSKWKNTSLPADAVTSVAGRTGAVVLAAADIASGTLAPTRLGSGTANTTTFLRGDNTWTVPSVTLAGDVAGTSGANSITTGAVDAAALASNAVTTVKLTDANVTESKLAISNAPSGTSAADEVLLWDASAAAMTWTPSSVVGDAPAWITGALRIAVVSTMPASPRSDTLYFVTT